MNKTEIVKEGLKCCLGNDCDYCTYQAAAPEGYCIDAVMKDAFDVIELLQSRLMEMVNEPDISNKPNGKIMMLTDMDDAFDVILKFIASPEYESVLNNIDDNKNAAFIGGLSFGSSLIMSRCKRRAAIVFDGEEMVKESKDAEVH